MPAPTPRDIAINKALREAREEEMRRREEIGEEAYKKEKGIEMSNILRGTQIYLARLREAESAGAAAARNYTFIG